MKKFIIIDNCLINKAGHFYEYDLSVVNSIEKDKFHCMVFAGKIFDEESDIEILPYFTNDFWAQEYCEDNIIYRKYLSKTNKFFDLIYSKIAGNKFFLFLKKHILKFFQKNESVEIYFKDLKYIEKKAALKFYREMKNLVKQYHFTEEDIIFFPNMNHWNFRSILYLDKKIEIIPQMKLLFRRNIFYKGEPTENEMNSPGYELSIFQKSARLLTNEMKNPNRYFSDTKRLKSEYEFVLDVDFTVLPVPFRHEFIKQKKMEDIKYPYKILFIGGAREEKGFQYVPELINKMKSYIDQGKVEFILHVGENPDFISKQAIDKISNSKNVHLIKKTLNETEYYELLNSSDIVLLLYDPGCYYSRSSCCFIESVVASKPFLVFDDSWMASEIQNSNYICKNSEDAVLKITGLLDNYNIVFSEMTTISRRWKDFYNPDTLVDIIVNKSLLKRIK